MGLFKARSPAGSLTVGTLTLSGTKFSFDSIRLALESCARCVQTLYYRVQQGISEYITQ